MERRIHSLSPACSPPRLVSPDGAQYNAPTKSQAASICGVKAGNAETVSFGLTVECSGKNEMRGFGIYLSKGAYIYPWLPLNLHWA